MSDSGAPDRTLLEIMARAMYAADEQYDHDHYGNPMLYTFEQSDEGGQYFHAAGAVIRVLYEAGYQVVRGDE